jgi:hypothetical protein
MSTRSITFIKCDRCEEEQEAGEFGALEAVIQCSVVLPCLATHRDGPAFPYDFTKKMDLCPKCKIHMKAIVIKFLNEEI